MLIQVRGGASRRQAFVVTATVAATLLVGCSSGNEVAAPAPTVTTSSPAPPPPPPPVEVAVEDVTVRRIDPARFLGSASVPVDEAAAREAVSTLADVLTAIVSTDEQRTAEPLRGDPTVTQPAMEALRLIGATRDVSVTPTLDLDAAGPFVTLSVRGAGGPAVELVFAQVDGAWHLVLFGEVAA